MEIIEKSICGNYRPLNEDVTGVFQNNTNQKLVLIADGMGGHEKGEVASNFVHDMIKENWECTNYFNHEDAKQYLRKLVIKTNRELFSYSTYSTSEHNMGTTLVLVAFIDDSIIILNVGDSRAYTLKKHNITQVTNDHTFVNMLVETGEITKEEARHHPQKNIVTKALGTSRLIQPDIFNIRNRQYDFIMLTTDGVTDVIADFDLHDMIYQSENIKEAIETIIETAGEKGSKDNISVVIADLKAGGD